MNTEEILMLMAGMAANKIATLEFEDLKLHSQPPALGGGNASSGLVTAEFRGFQSPYPVTAQGAMDAVKAAVAAVPAKPVKPAKTADERLAEMQARTAAVRGKAASGIGPSTSRAIKQIFKEAKQPPSAPKPTTT